MRMSRLRAPYFCSNSSVLTYSPLQYKNAGMAKEKPTRVTRENIAKIILAVSRPELTDRAKVLIMLASAISTAVSRIILMNEFQKMPRQIYFVNLCTRSYFLRKSHKMAPKNRSKTTVAKKRKVPMLLEKMSASS